MIKKDILIIHSSLRGGGAEKVLIDILKNFDYEQFNVDLLIVNKEGVYMTQIPEDVNMLPLNIRKFGVNAMRILVYTNLYGIILKHQLRKFFDGKNYDTIISFMEGVPVKCHSYLMDKATRNISWVHTDLLNNHYSKVLFPIPDSEKHIYSRFDEVVFVSNKAKEQFNKLFKTDIGTVIYNLIDRKAILKKAAAESIEKKKFTICNIGRLIPQKRQDRIVLAAEILKAKGIDADFWILGEGGLNSQLQELTKAHGVEAMIHYLGFKENPYCYLNRADLFLLSSDSEGLPLVVCEALCLGKPVVSTNITGPSELIQDGVNGILTELAPESIADAIEYLYNHPEELASYSKNAEIRGKELSNSEAILQRIYNIIQ